MMPVDHEKMFFQALQTIAKGFQTPSQLKRIAEKSYGLSYEESLEMAYENIQQIAKNAIKGYRTKKETHQDAM